MRPGLSSPPAQPVPLPFTPHLARVLLCPACLRSLPVMCILSGAPLHPPAPCPVGSEPPFTLTRDSHLQGPPCPGPRPDKTPLDSALCALLQGRAGQARGT